MSNTNAILAKFIRRDEWDFNCDDRNDLAEVLGKLTMEQWSRVRENLPRHWSGPLAFDHWTHTCNPAIIAEAVARVVGEVGR